MNIDEQREIGARIATENNRATADPIFVVQQKRRIFGVDADYADAHVWLHDEDCEREADEEESARLDNGIGTEDWTRVGVIDVWEWVQPFFTEKGANDYLAANRHNLNEPRVYVASAYRNREWQGVRAIFKAAPSPASAAPEREWTERPMPVIHDALDRTHRRACGETGIHYMSIPPDFERDADLILSDAIEELEKRRALPHFAPRPKVRVPTGYLVSSPIAQTHGVALGCAEADRQWIKALRSAGIEIEGASDEA